MPFLDIACLVVKSGMSCSPRTVLWQMVEGDLEPAHPIAVTFPANSEAIDALLGTKRGSPRVVPDETKLAITNCASRGSARLLSEQFGIVVSSWFYRSCSSIILFSPSHVMSLCAFATHTPRVSVSTMETIETHCFRICAGCLGRSWVQPDEER